jgi:hypothetical protein
MSRKKPQKRPAGLKKPKLFPPPPPSSQGLDKLTLAKVGIAALIDEATGYQQNRGKDALRKLAESYSRGEA